MKRWKVSEGLGENTGLEPDRCVKSLMAWGEFTQKARKSRFYGILFAVNLTHMN